MNLTQDELATRIADQEIIAWVGSDTGRISVAGQVPGPSGRRPRRTRLASSVVALAAMAAPAAAAAQVQSPRDTHAWRVSLQVGTTAVATNNVLLAPLSIGGGVLAERGMLGLEAAAHADVATICDNPSGGDGGCGVLFIWDVAPRLTPLPDLAWSPYAAARFQLTHSRNHGFVPAAGPRLGVRYRGARLGGYFEGGPSFVSAEDGAFGQFVSDSRWFPQISLGMTFTFR